MKFTLDGKFNGEPYAATLEGHGPELGRVTGLARGLIFSKDVMTDTKGEAQRGPITGSGGALPDQLDFEFVPQSMSSFPVPVSVGWNNLATYVGTAEVEVLDIEIGPGDPVMIFHAKASGTLQKSTGSTRTSPTDPTNAMTFNAESLTYPWHCDKCGGEEEPTEAKTYPVPALSGDCPQAVVDAFIGGTEIKYASKSVSIGSVTYPCRATRNADPQRSEREYFSCMLKTTVDAEGCSWTALGWVRPGTFNAYVTVTARASGCSRTPAFCNMTK